MQNHDVKILCVDDERDILDLYRLAIEQAGFSAVLCKNADEALAALQSEDGPILFAISDYMMPGRNGLELRAASLAIAPSIPFVIVSAFVTKEMALSALDLKVEAFYDKPIASEVVHQIIEKYGKPRLEAIRESQMLESIFIEEASNIVEEMDSVLLALDTDRGNTELLNLIYRGAHTIKGSSGILSTDIITRYVHKYEDIISSIKKGQLAFSNQVYEVLLRGFDRIKELVAALPDRTVKNYRLDALLPELDVTSQEAPGAKAAVERSGATQPQANLQKAKENISVPITMLDELSGYSGEITVIRNMVNKLIKALERDLAGNKEIVSLGELLDEMHKINGTIQTRITDLRKVPLTGVLKPIPRIIRDLARDLGKSIRLQIDGEALRVDSALAAVCSNSLVHLVRNAADHGLEPPADREAAGKPTLGTINISCREHRDEVEITISDDGRGIDLNRIRQKAIEKGLYTASELATMPEQQQFGIIFASGFSTAAKVTDVSGRGVGMDMVRSSVESIGGQIQVESAVGKGSTLRLRLPIPKSVLIINSLLVEASGRSFAVPQDSIIRILRINQDRFSDMVQQAAAGCVLRTGDEILPLIDLGSVLSGRPAESRMPGFEKTQSDACVEVLILKSDSCHYALRVDQVQDSEEIVVKRIQSCFNPRGTFAGATFMGDGTIGLILDVNGIADLAGIKNIQNAVAAHGEQHVAGEPAALMNDYLLFNLGTKAVFGLPLEQVYRLEEFDKDSIQFCGEERVVLYRDEVMPLISFHQLLKLNHVADPASDHTTKLQTIVAKRADRYFGLEITSVIDIASTDHSVSDAIRDRAGIIGNTIIRERSVTLVQLPNVLKHPTAS